jgi:outer membrane protein TolC
LKRLVNILLLSVVTLGLYVPGVCQELAILPSLDELLATAVENSPLVKTQLAAVKKQEAEAKRNGKLWLQTLQLEVGSRYNTFFTSEGNLPVAGSQSGLVLRFSLYDLLARKNIVDRSRYEIVEAQERAHQQETVIKQAIISVYYRVTLSQKLVEVSNERVQSAVVHQTMAEQEFKAGDIPVSELSRVSQIASVAKLELERARSEYIEAIHLLEVIAGIKLIEP